MAKKTAPKPKKAIVKPVHHTPVRTDLLPLLIPLLLVSIILYCVILKQSEYRYTRPVLKNKATIEMKKVVSPSAKPTKAIVSPKQTN